LHTDMMTFFTWAMADMQKAETHSKAVNECLDYIHYHLHEKITVPILAEHVHLNPTYLSELFKRETGTAISQYITDKRMEAAENMLKYSEYSFDEIAQILAYRSQSHFSKVFKKHSGMTPGEYRTKYAQNGIWPE
ncbi:MAG TPA: AraC family transcriptional regulator, partial [Bifidobacterium adolescentis]